MIYLYFVTNRCLSDLEEPCLSELSITDSYHDDEKRIKLSIYNCLLSIPAVIRINLANLLAGLIIDREKHNYKSTRLYKYVYVYIITYTVCFFGFPQFRYTIYPEI